MTVGMEYFKTRCMQLESEVLRLKSLWEQIKADNERLNLMLEHHEQYLTEANKRVAQLEAANRNIIMQLTACRYQREKHGNT